MCWAGPAREVMPNDQPSMFWLPQNTAFSALSERQPLDLEGRRGLPYIVDCSKEHEKRLCKLLVSIKSPCNDFPGRAWHPAAPQPRCKSCGIRHVDIEWQPALPHSIVRLPPKRARLVGERRATICIRFHADPLHGTSQNLLETLSTLWHKHATLIRASGERSPIRPLGIGQRWPQRTRARNQRRQQEAPELPAAGAARNQSPRFYVQK